MFQIFKKQQSSLDTVCVDTSVDTCVSVQAHPKVPVDRNVYQAPSAWARAVSMGPERPQGEFACSAGSGQACPAQPIRRGPCYPGLFSPVAAGRTPQLADGARTTTACSPKSGGAPWLHFRAQFQKVAWPWTNSRWRTQVRAAGRLALVLAEGQRTVHTSLLVKGP